MPSLQSLEIEEKGRRWLFHVRTGTGDADIVREVLHTDYYREARDLLPEDAVVIDVGAHIGSFGIFAAGQGARVWALEPIPANYALLKQNIELNHLESRVKPFNVAAWSGEGERMLSVADDSTGGSSFFYWNKAAPQIPVRCVSLEEFMHTEGISVCDVLKLDCEGAELQILSTLSPETWRRIRVVVGEYHLFADYALEQIQDLLSTHGFLLFTRSEGTIGYFLAMSTWLEVPAPQPLSPISVTELSSPYTQLPVLGFLWQLLRRPLHGLIVFYVNQLISSYNENQRRNYMYTRWLRWQSSWLANKRDLQ
jgi:FkbM family methyltransferase